MLRGDMGDEIKLKWSRGEDKRIEKKKLEIKGTW